MVKANIQRHPAVIAEDLPDICSKIKAEDPETANRILAAIESTFQLPSDFPESGMMYRSRESGVRNIRVMPARDFRSFLILYKFEIQPYEYSTPFEGLEAFRAYSRQIHENRSKFNL